MAGGRPREVIPEAPELIELGKDLLEWVSDDTAKDCRMRWCDWFSIKHDFLYSQWKLMVQKPEFRPYYEKAQSYLARKWLFGEVNTSIAHRFLRLYCPEVKEDEDQVSEKANSAQIEELKTFFGKIHQTDLNTAKTKAPKE